MKNRLQPLTDKEIQTVHDACMQLLGNTGVSFKAPEAVEIFKRHGVRTDGEKVFLTEKQVLDALKTVPEEFTIQARNPKNNVRIGGDHFAFGPAWAAPFVIDAGGGAGPEP